MNIETILTPAELPALAQRDLRETACVVFDILRATSTFVTALQNGAKEIFPVGEIADALAVKKNQPDVLLAGERHGVKIRADGMNFDLGNSPREFIPEKIRGKTIVSTTTNGTRALRACVGAKIILASSFLNLSATANFLEQQNVADILLVCAGTGEKASLEDALAAGALTNLLITRGDVRPTNLSDAAQITRRTFLSAQIDLPAVFSNSENARRLAEISDLRKDVPFCLQRDVFNLVAEMQSDGAIRRI